MRRSGHAPQGKGPLTHTILRVWMQMPILYRTPSPLNLCESRVSQPKGPYRVIDKANPGSYNLQQLPFLKAVFRMERNFSALVLHKMVSTRDSWQ